MTTSEFIRYIKKQGVRFHYHGKKHDTYINPANGQTTEVPRHAAKEIGTGLKNSMLKDLGLK